MLEVRHFSDVELGIPEHVLIPMFPLLGKLVLQLHGSL